MEQATIDPRLLRPNPWNTNIVSPENALKLDASVRRNGMFKPIIVRTLPDGALEILGGAHRAESAIRVGLEAVPVLNVGPIDDQRAKEISLLDNARYGADDTLALAELLGELGSPDDLASFLPYSDNELTAIMSSNNIDLDTLGLDADDEVPETAAEIAAAAPKTHTILRFKASLGDAANISKLIEDTQKKHGFTEADDLTNAGDALVFLLLRSGEPV